jgi:hypothetical protein
MACVGGGILSAESSVGGSVTKKYVLRPRLVLEESSNGFGLFPD